jgi:hypothetical protein
MSGDDLLTAAEKGDLDKVKSLLDRGVNIHHKNEVSIKNKYDYLLIYLLIELLVDRILSSLK